jgi:hypothetical protein
MFLADDAAKILLLPLKGEVDVLEPSLNWMEKFRNLYFLSSL